MNIPAIFRSARAVWNSLSPSAQAAIKATPDYDTAIDVIVREMATPPETRREAFGGIGDVLLGALVGGLIIASPVDFSLGLLVGEK